MNTTAQELIVNKGAPDKVKSGHFTIMELAIENNLKKDEEILFESLDNPSLFRVLVNKYQEAFLRKAVSIVKSREEAEDIVQEAFVKIYFNGKKFKKFDGIEFKSWAYKVLINTAISRYRKISNRWRAESVNLADLELISERNLSVQNLVSEKEVKSIAADLLSRLPRPLAKLISMYYIDGKSYKEIAKEESITVPALKMKLFRTKKLLKKIVEKDNENKK